MSIDKLFEEQLAVWPEARERYLQLQLTEHKQIAVAGRTYDVMFNPARMKSAAAKVEGGKVDRPCFLCDNALPKEQTRIELTAVPSGRKYNLMVNPFPITDRHFTIVSQIHERQDFIDPAGKNAFLKSRAWDMAYFADLMPDYLIFFNGACSGASAPDHMHFQAVPKDAVPLTHWDWQQRLDMGVTSEMPLHLEESDHKNVICWTEGAECHWLVIDRKAHRPRQYQEGFMISPAALEFCGLVPLARREDFDQMDAPLLADILSQCRRQEPMIHVGIMEGQQIRFSAEERTHAINYIGEGRMLHVMDYGSNRAEKEEIQEYKTYSQPFTLEGVTIGKQFHWQKEEDQSFMGSLRIIAQEGELHAINTVPLEEYLKSVISSEMSAMNNLELLKTHAIISRSWALRTLFPTSQSNSLPREERGGAQSFLRIWDGHDHTLFDVCADDHCQRYQGISRQASPLVEQAIRETRGQVLMDAKGEICDARFSKCCGGKTELFSTCWQDRDYDYLQSVEDPWCDTKEERVLRLILNDYDQSTVDFHDWEVTYTQSELTDLINRKLAAEIPDYASFAKVEKLVPVKRGPSGRIFELDIAGIGTDGKELHLTIGKELLIRKALSETHLYSSAFDVLINDQPQPHITLRGCGWGHGVGLCQIGAANMSQHGKNYREILLHYFRGARIETLY